MTQTQATPNPDPFDAAASRARAQLHRPLRIAWAGVLVIVVGVAAFYIGRESTASPRALQTPTTMAESDGHEHLQPNAAELWTCSMHPWVIQKEPGVCPICHMELTRLRAGSATDGAVTIDPVVVQNMGVRIAEVTRGPVVQSVRAVGYLKEPEPLHRDINLRVSGWIEKLYANVDGMPIVKGKPLFDLYSPDLTVAVDELIAARRQLERNPGDATTRGLMDSARRKLTLLGMETEQIDEMARLNAAPTTVPILSPIDGHLTSKMVYEGSAVKAGDLVMRLASRHLMWIDTQVPEQQMSLISDGQPVQATLVSQPGKVYSGKVLFVHPHMDEQTRTALVRIELENKDLALRQGMYATVEILADSYREAPLLPREAVIDTGRRQLVFVALGDGRFQPRHVTLGLPGRDGMVEVTEGLSPGDKVVSSGQFLLDSESRLKDAIAKQLFAGMPGHPQDAPPAATQPASNRIAVAHADDLMLAYLDVARQLGARQQKDTPISVQPLVAVAEMSIQHSSPQGKPLAAAISDAAKRLDGKPIAEQREAFVQLGAAAVAMARQAQLSASVGPTLYIIHCPMAFHEKGADWVQDKPTIENPFYPTQMKRCGEVVDQIQIGK